MQEINLAKLLSQALLHLVKALAKQFTDHEMSGLPMRAKYKHFRTIFESTLSTILQPFPILPFLD